MAKNSTLPKPRERSLKISGKLRATISISVSLQSSEWLERTKEKLKSLKEKKRLKSKKFLTLSQESTTWTSIRWNQSLEPFWISREMERSLTRLTRTSWRRSWSITTSQRRRWRTSTSSKWDSTQSSTRPGASSLSERTAPKRTSPSASASATLNRLLKAMND